MVKITLSIDADALWLDFRHACLDHKTSASKAIERLMREQLARWAEAQGDQPAAAKQYARILHSVTKQALTAHKTKET